MNANRDIAVIGMHGKFPKASDLTQFWDNLTHSRDCITNRGVVKEASAARVLAAGILEEAECFDPEFFNLTPKEAEWMDPQQRLFMLSCWRALENAGYNPDNYDGVISLYAAANRNTYLEAQQYKARSLSEDFQIYTSNDREFLTTKVSYKLNLKGESIAIQTACSSSLVSVHLACQSLLAGKCDMAIAGGVNVTFPQEKGYLYQEGMMYSPDGYSRPFDKRANGMVEGQGVGAVVLKTLAKAIEDRDPIHAVIKSSAVNNDGKHKVGYIAPGVAGQSEVIGTALRLADIPAETIGYIETHGTGTQLGDAIEIEALTQAFRLFTDQEKYCAIGSVKANIGHLIHAAGIAGFIKAVLSVKHGVLLPSGYLEQINPIVPIDRSPFYINRTTERWPTQNHPRRAGVSSFGIGGTNAHVIIEEAPDRAETTASGGMQLLTLSAKNNEMLRAYKSQLLGYVLSDETTNIEDLVYTLNVGRRALDCRWAVLNANVN